MPLRALKPLSRKVFTKIPFKLGPGFSGMRNGLTGRVSSRA